MAKSKETKETMGKDKQQHGYLKDLQSSALFHLSAGSKELFHSDFLYWLAKQHWEVFIRVMRNLANQKANKPFGWESAYSFQDKNLEIRRECKHFDLAIYVRPKKKWVPVFILENKVKSLPYAKQLNEYSSKAEKEWGNQKKNEESITRVLLSMTDIESLLTEGSELKNTWSFKNYTDLAKALV